MERGWGTGKPPCRPWQGLGLYFSVFSTSFIELEVKGRGFGTLGSSPYIAPTPHNSPLAQGRSLANAETTKLWGLRHGAPFVLLMRKWRHRG